MKTTDMIKSSNEKTKQDQIADLRIKIEEKLGINKEWTTPRLNPSWIPEPLGPYCLVALCKPNEMYEGKEGIQIVKASVSQIEMEEDANDIGYLIKMGPTAFRNLQNGFVETPEQWGIKIGDLVQLNQKYSGTNIENNLTQQLDIVFRLVADTSFIGKYEE